VINLELLGKCGFVNAKQLEDNIFCIPNFLSEDDLKIFINIIDKLSENDWEKINKFQDLDWHHKFYDYNDEQLASMVRDKFNALLSFFPNSVVYGLGRILRQRPQDMMNAHVDETYDDFNKLNRDYAVVIYLNDDYSGGELSFVNLDIKIKPDAGSLMIFKTGEKYLHEVKTVNKDKARYCLPAWIFSTPVDKE
jgi:Rps23 Pro-64 3,4-dihydroxylase Tpa1-like proline 4-hydroxylase